MSPALSVTGFSFVPGPAAIILPLWGFSLAVSGIIIPDEVVVSASYSWTKTLSESN